MNCANHADASAVAYCRTCGKALCANCTRPVKGVIYCEDCLGAKMAGTTPPAAPGFAPGAAPVAPGFVASSPATPASGPNPALAGILGAIPFGVGAVYNGQYAKGLAHLAIFAFLVYGANHSHSWDVVFGFAIAFFWFYQVFDAVRSAKAIQAGSPSPDPFGLTEMVSGGSRMDASKIPAGALVLILLGVLFLLNTISEYRTDRFWPILLILLGCWMFARNFGMLGSGNSGTTNPRYHTRRLMGPAIITAVGVLFLLSELEVASFDRTWPIILLVIGAVKLLQSSVGPGASIPPGPGVGSTPDGGPSIPPPPPSEVSHG